MNTVSPRCIHIHPADNVVVAARPVEAGARLRLDGTTIEVAADVPAGHKIATVDLRAGDHVVKYGHVIGRACTAVRQGEWVHSHNLETLLSGNGEYAYCPRSSHADVSPASVPTFEGYRRSDGCVGTRNEIWVINTVGCVNRSAQRIARMCNDRFTSEVDGVHAFAHPFGCSQLGDDLRYTQRILAGLLRHPNAGGVVVLGLGCENNQMDQLLALAGDVERERIRFFNSQDVLDEVEEGVAAVGELVEIVRRDERTASPVSKLILGLKCGGSDGFSGISANPVVGRVADRWTSHGGTALLTEVPEMFGAEQQLMNRARDIDVFDRIVSMIGEFKQYFAGHGQPVYENPSPGNKEGGLTTLEEKSLGAIQKGGQASVASVVGYGEAAAAGEGGLALIYGPGNDGVSVTAEVASGASIILFTTGRGTPLGFPVPTIKISSNSDIAERKPHWIDFNAGALLDGTASIDSLADDLFALILRVASGKDRAQNELNDYREIAIWKEGVTL